MINLLLPGTSVIYYGDEIGMSNNATDLAWNEVQDPYTTNSQYCNQTQFEKDECICRDPSRTPMQVLTLLTKGQIISKGLLVSSVSSKKRTKEFVFFA